MAEEEESTAARAATTESVHRELTTSEINWYQFWYDLRPYLHPSWLISIDGQPEGGLIISADNTQYLWNIAYPLLCSQLSLPQSHLENELPESFWKEFLPKLANYPTDLIKIAGIAYYADVSPGNVNKLCTRNQHYKEAVQIGRSLSLGSRCQLFDENPTVDEGTINSAGLYFLYHALKANCLSYWMRARLAFHKEIILEIEQKSPSHLFSDSTNRSFQRLWKNINSLYL